MATLFPYPQLSRLPWGGGCSRLRIGPRSRTPRGADGRAGAAPHALPGEVGRWIILDGRGASGCLEDLGIAERRPCPVRVRGDAILLVRRLCRRGFRFHRSEEHTSELQSLMRISYAVFCLKKKIHTTI